MHLKALVAFDTRNPPRAIDGGGIFAYLCDQLAGFDCEIVDHGAGAVSLYAVRGKPKRLFNVHLDTVPDSPHWSASTQTCNARFRPRPPIRRRRNSDCSRRRCRPPPMQHCAKSIPIR